ncbi:hypothetical protein LMH87_001959 [Akanthomyces muscarius]|uniref:RNA helicase n=1 Tax=Akanthomyces muscarius TaxID=2231603 RepID=A0A9W8UIR9_AKAMU|nr:hypothetical protein LMH87_001959 [Akanthomyces muscarius]KAJ4147442.1 hypothetical protein LMH87_001959 [Akanthomyces muscarius]
MCRSPQMQHSKSVFHSFIILPCKARDHDRHDYNAVSQPYSNYPKMVRDMYPLSAARHADSRDNLGTETALVEAERGLCKLYEIPSHQTSTSFGEAIGRTPPDNFIPKRGLPRLRESWTTTKQKGLSVQSPLLRITKSEASAATTEPERNAKYYPKILKFVRRDTRHDTFAIMVHHGLNDIEAGLVESSYDATIVSFEKMALGSDLRRGVYEYGFDGPSALQQRVILPVIQGHDIVVVAQSATGKTSALCISVLQKIDPDIKACQALILVSNQDLAGQIQKTISGMGRFMQISHPANIFKSDAGDDMGILHDAQQVVIGEPSQVYNMLRSGTITAENINVLFLDDADELLSRNIAEQICGIHELLPESTQFILFSTTTPHCMLETAAKLMHDPLYITVAKTEYPLDGIKQSYIVVETEERKLDILSELYESSALARGIIFCNRRKKVEWLEQKLTDRGLATSAMHADMRAIDRADILAGFRASASRVLIATEMLARGLDVQQMTLIVNFELPANPENYIHRTGLGRHSGRKSPVINLITADEVPRVQEIEQLYNTRIENMH